MTPPPFAFLLASRWLLVGVLLAAAALRLPLLSAAPPGVNNDVAYYGVDALATLAGNAQIFYPANFGREPLMIYLMAIATALFGPSIEALRFPAVAAGMLTVAAMAPLGYRLFRARGDVFARRAGLLAAAITAVSFWHVFYSRAGFRAILLPLVMVVAIYWLQRAFDGERRAWAISGALLGLSFYTYLAARLVPLLPATLLAWDLLADRASVRAWWRHWTVLAVVATIVCLPLGLYFVARPDQFVSRIDQLSPLAVAEDSPIPSSTPFRAVVGTLGMFAFDGGDNPQLYLPGRGVFDLAILPFFAIGGVAALAAARRDRSARTLLVWLVVLLLAAAIARDRHPQYLRSLGALPPTMLLAAFGMTLALAWAERRPSLRRSAIPTAAILLAVSLGVTTYDYWVRWAPGPDTRRVYAAGLTAIAQEARRSPPNETTVLLAHPARGEGFAYQTFAYLAGDRGRTVLADPATLSADVAPLLVPGRVVRLVDFPPTRLGPDDATDSADFLLRRAGALLDERSREMARERWYRVVGAPEPLPHQTETMAFPGGHVVSTGRWWSADGRSLALAFVARVTDPTVAPDRLSLRLLDVDNRLLAQVDRPIVDRDGRAPNRWTGPGETPVYVILPLPGALASGIAYPVQAAAYRQTDPDTAALQWLRSVTLPRPAPVTDAELSDLTRVDQPLAGGTILGYRLDRAAVRPGERFTAEVYWRAPTRSRGGLTTFAPTDETTSAPDTAHRYPIGPSDGQVVRLVLPLASPPTAQGDLPITLALLNAGDDRPTTVATIPIVERARRFAAPTPENALDAVFLHPRGTGTDAAPIAVARLVGFDLDVIKTPRRTLDLTLHWQALIANPPDFATRVDVLVDGQVVASATRPPESDDLTTRAWAVDEYVADNILIPLPPSARLITVAVGAVATTRDGGRLLPLASGGDMITLGAFPAPQ